jgi:hypothetical protein
MGHGMCVKIKPNNWDDLFHHVPWPGEATVTIPQLDLPAGRSIEP